MSSATSRGVMTMSERGTTQLVLNVESRHTHDTIVSHLMCSIFILVPIILYALSVLVSNNVLSMPFFKSLFPIYADAAVFLGYPLLMEGLVLSVFLFFLYYRARSHEVRDSNWYACVNRDLSAMGCREIPVPEDSKPRKLSVYFIFGLMGALFVVFPFALDSYVCFIRGGSFPLAMLAYFGLVAVVLLICSVNVIRMPYSHECEQAAFTEKVAEALAEHGFMVQPMSAGLRKPRLLLPFPIAMAAGAGIGFLVNSVFGAVMGIATAVVLVIAANVVISVKSTNKHIISQWIYEEYLVRCFDDVLSGRPIQDSGCTVDKEELKLRARVPPMIHLAELLVIAISVMYMFNTLGRSFDIIMNPTTYHMWTQEYLMYVGMTIFTLVLLTLTMNSLLGLRSRRHTAWRRVTRNCLTFTLSTLVSAFVMVSDSYVTLYTLNPYLTLGILYNMFLFLTVSLTIRRFYTPINRRVPPIKDWMRYVLLGDLEFGRKGSSVSEADDTIIDD